MTDDLKEMLPEEEEEGAQAGTSGNEDGQETREGKYTIQTKVKGHIGKLDK